MYMYPICTDWCRTIYVQALTDYSHADLEQLKKVEAVESWMQEYEATDIPLSEAISLLQLSVPEEVDVLFDAGKVAEYGYEVIKEIERTWRSTVDGVTGGTGGPWDLALPGSPIKTDRFTHAS